MFDFFLLYKDAYINVIVMWFVAVVMPGPDMFLVVFSSIQNGRRYAIASVGGIVLGTFIWLLIGFFFIGFFAQTSFFFWIRIFGGCYLIYMAFKIFISLRQKTSQGNFSQNFLKTEDAKKGFLKGFFTNLSNPKAPIFVSVVLSSLPPNVSLLNSSLLFILMLFIPTIWFTSVVYFFRIKRILNIFLKYSKILDVIAILIFGSVGFGLLIEAS